MTGLHNLIIPRVNINSKESILYSIELVKEYDFDSFIIFSSDIIKFDKVEPFKIENFHYFTEQISKLKKNHYLYIDAERGFGHRCEDGFLYDKSFIGHDSLELKLVFDRINHELKINKIFCNLAPVVDIDNNSENILKNRTLGKDINEIIKNAEIFLKSCFDNNIAACLKHFPGHGAINGDTHDFLASSNSPIDEILEQHIKPFEKLAAQCDLIMINHGWYKALDNEPTPASMSFNIITNLLKNKMSYNGLIMIDSVRMKALTNNYLEEEIVNGFFLAGGDLFLDPINPIQCLEYIDKISQKKLEYFQSKIKKVLNFKSKFRLYG